MDKDKALLAVVLIGGAALYIMSTKKSCNCNKSNFTDTETVKDLGKEIKSQSEPVAVQAMPRFGRPVNVMPPKDTKPVFESFIDVQKNAYFKPKVGAFYK
jgi:hypothetical protein